MDPCEIASRIDNTLIKPLATESMLLDFCLKSVRYRFNAIYVPQWFLLKAIECVSGVIGVATVVNFPHGTGSIDVKVKEVKWAVEIGASAVDYVINLGKAAEGDYDYLEKEARAIKDAAGKVIVKAIIEIENFSPKEVEKIVESLISGGVDYIKTSTGYGKRGVKVDDVILLKNIIGDRAGIKAAGGVRTLDQAVSLFEAGADLIGTSSGINIVEEAVRAAKNPI